MEIALNKCDESFLLKCGVIISILFMCVTIWICSGYKVKIPDFFKNTENKSSDVGEVVHSNTNIVIGDITTYTEGRLIINLPGGVTENNTNMAKDLLNKRISISFPKGVKNFDNNNIINNASVVSNVDIRVTDTMAYVTLSLNGVIDCESCFDNGQLFLDFFVPSEYGRPVVVIDAGHGGTDVGAINQGIYEKDIDLQICNQLKNLLDGEEILVYYTRVDDSYPSVEERVDFANEINPDLFISIHSNYYDNSDINGTSVLYNVNDEREKGSLWLSEIMCSEVSKSCGTYDKGIVTGNDIHVVRHSKAPVALIEVGFMSNDHDFKVLTTENGQKKIAQGVYNGIIRALTELGKY